MEQFLADVEAYAAACSLKPGTVVQRAGGLGGAIWAQWKAGTASPTMRKADEIRAYIAAHPPPAVSAVADPVPHPALP